MKKYSTDITKLYDKIGFDKITTGSVYTSAAGAKVEIKDIYINAMNENAEVLIDYVVIEKEETKNMTSNYNEVVNLIRAKAY
jgi:hypothetical protein